MRAGIIAAVSLLALTGCTAPSQQIVVLAPAPPAHDALYQPDRVIPGRLAYAPDRSTFAPMLTEGVAYPTQPEANAAYQRLVATGSPDLWAASVKLFGCKPGALDGRTGRTARHPGNVVLCATDFLDASGRPLGRLPVNFIYAGRAWAMQLVNASRAPVPWLSRERSPRDPWWWVPGRDRYE